MPANNTKSMLDMIGRLGRQTMEMNGGSSASYLAASLHPLHPLMLYFYDLGRSINGLIAQMPNMTGRPGYRTMEMNGGSSAPYLACTPCVPLFVHCLIRVEAEGLLDYQGRAGIISIVRWNLRPVIFGVDNSSDSLSGMIRANRFARFARIG